MVGNSDTPSDERSHWVTAHRGGSGGLPPCPRRDTQDVGSGRKLLRASAGLADNGRLHPPGRCRTSRCCSRAGWLRSPVLTFAWLARLDLDERLEEVRVGRASEPTIVDGARVPVCSRYRIAWSCEPRAAARSTTRSNATRWQGRGRCRTVPDLEPARHRPSRGRLGPGAWRRRRRAGSRRCRPAAPVGRAPTMPPLD